MKYLSIIFILLISISAQASTFTVTRSDDRDSTCILDNCTLREAIKAANENTDDDTIIFSPTVSYITLSIGFIDIGSFAGSNTGKLIISGSGADILTISGDNKSSIFRAFYATVTIQDVTLTKGKAPDFSSGGAISTIQSSLTLKRVFITQNSAGVLSYPAAYAYGGGLALSGGPNFIEDSIIANNQATYFGGGIFNNGGSLTITNFTISGNSVNNFGGGIGGSGNKTFRNVTITNNTARANCQSNCVGSGAGVFMSGNVLNFSNTIISGNHLEQINNQAGSDDLHYSAGNIYSEGNNIIRTFPGDSAKITYPIKYQLSDILDTNPLLGMLQNNGGTTPTHALLAGSPAIDAGNNLDAPATDQRGFARIVGRTIDIGAFEFTPVKSRKRVRFF